MPTETVLMPNIDGSGEVVEFCVKAGDQISAGDSLLVIESDKASMEVLSPADGTVISWQIELGADVASESPLMILETVATKSEPGVEPINNNQKDSTLQQERMVNAGPAVRKLARELALEITELSGKARKRKLAVDDMKGGCFTASSMGAIGGTGFTPIINGPEVAILGIAKSAIKPQWDGVQRLDLQYLNG